MGIARRIYTKLTDAILSVFTYSFIERFSDELLRLRLRSQEIMRQRIARKSGGYQGISHIKSYSGELLERSVLEKHTPWDSTPVPASNIPGMLTEAEKRYYGFITGFYSGAGQVVELGSWLGLSTFYLIASLRDNPHFSKKRLYVYDDFIWRGSWMDQWVVGTDITPPENHDSFHELFIRQLETMQDDMDVRQQKICDYDGNEHLPSLQWEGGPIEMLFVDCGRSLAVNEAWWTILSQSFIPDRTLIIMQDWQNHKQVPEVFWENTKIFTDSKMGQLEMIHEVRFAGIATFIYREQREN